MKSFIFGLLILASITTFAQEVKLESALIEASENNEVVLLYFSGSDWCIPCMRLNEKVLSTPEFYDFMEGSIILFQIDFPRTDEASDEYIEHKRSLAAKYNSEGSFPKLVLIDSNGDVLWEEAGFKNKEESYYEGELAPHITD